MSREPTNADVATPLAAAFSADTPEPDAATADRTESPPPGKLRGRLATQFVSTVGVAFAIVGLQMGQGILLARILGPLGRGEYATAIFYVQLLLYVGLFGGLEVICRYAAGGGTDRQQLRRAALRLGVVTGSLTTALAMSLSLIAIPSEKRYLIPMALVCALSITGQQIVLIMTAVDRGRGEFGAYNARRVFAAAAFPTLLLVWHLCFGVTLELACVLLVAASLVSVLACLTGLPRPFRGASDPPVKTLLKESRPYAFSMFATDLFERLDLLLILWLAGLEEQGFYAAMIPVTYPLTVIPNTLGMFLFNAGADEKKRLRVTDVHRILASSLAVQTVCTVAFMLVIGTLIEFLYGEAFGPAVVFALWLAPVAAIKGILQGLDSYVKGRGKPLASIRCRFAAAVLVLAVTWALYDQYGAVAVAIAALAGQILCFFWLSIIVYADVRERETRPLESDS